MGDKNQVTPLHNFGAESLWTHELEAGLMEGALDLIVHSLKDMPTRLPASCTIGAILTRGDPRDTLVLKSSLQTIYTTLASLPAGPIIGTSSVRRAAQIARKYPHLRFADVRGNVGTRLAKLDARGTARRGLGVEKRLGPLGRPRRGNWWRGGRGGF
ncbi:MAG: porphobilinogen deaminase [Geoglossum umbratile]|nr:MAG: porphobilinogen deaminase [Geoglossum umbratile]